MQDDVLSIETTLTLTWRDMPETVSVASLRRNNRLTFALLEILNEPQSVTHESHHSSPDLQRIENKLNLVIDMLSGLCGQSQQHADAIPVRFSCKGLEWQSDTAPDATASLLLELYPDNEMQQALRIVARVISVGTPHEGRYLVRTRFTSLDETEVNYLEKWIFAHHRRMIAQTRNFPSA